MHYYSIYIALVILIQVFILHAFYLYYFCFFFALLIFFPILWVEFSSAFSSG